MIAALLCRLFGHKERRLTKKERDELGDVAYGRSDMEALAAVHRHRVCRRCEAKRTTRERKTKATA